MQNGEWVFISALFSVTTSFDTQRLKPIYLLLHNVTGIFVILLSQDGFGSDCPETKLQTITSKSQLSV